MRAKIFKNMIDKTRYHCNQNVVDTSALLIPRIQYEYTQCGEGAQDVNSIWVIVVNCRGVILTHINRINNELNLSLLITKSSIKSAIQKQIEPV